MDPTAKQQIVERVKQASNVLVTVSTNPSVDQLAACIGLTLLLNKIEKHGTAVFSGQVPSTLEFLQPEKTLEPTTDSLRDFIISLDKSKADKLRYKVEDEVVRIFITPYRSSLSEKDLIFSQGDFNVDVVIALGVTNKEQLDAAITAHGRILHDATVVSLNSGDKASDVGQINWNDPAASSLSEMIVSISEAFGSNLLDNQMATAFLTGIVAETERFSNQKTTPKVMTMSAQLMAAGANQQLIAAKLNVAPADTSGTGPVAPSGGEDGGNQDQKGPDGQLSIDHEPKEEFKPPDDSQIHIDDKGLLKTKDEMYEEQASNPPEQAGKPETEANQQEPARTWLNPDGKPSRNGTLSANTKPEEYQEAINPLADNQPPADRPMPTLSHDSPKMEPESDYNDEYQDSPPPPEPDHEDPPPAEPAAEPEPQPELPDETPRPYDPPSAEPPAEPESSNSEPEPPFSLDPNQHSNETLSQIQEEAHDANDHKPDESPPDNTDSARDAIEKIRANMPPDNTPLANLNALPLGEPLHQETPVPLPYNPDEGHELKLPNPDGPNQSAGQQTDTPDLPPSAPPVPPPLPLSPPPYMNPGSSSANSTSLPPPQPPV